MAKLDLSKDHGRVMGCELGRVYEQNGKHFDAEGNEWIDPRVKADDEKTDAKSDKVAKVSKTKVTPKADAEAQAQVDAQSKAA